MTEQQTPPEILKTLAEREELTQRMVRALEHLSVPHQISIICSFIPLSTLRRVVEFQERRN